jgi:GNAT superfamily N-acetyltransferase
MIRRVESDDWERLRDVRLRALASDPDAFLETVEDARTFPDERWRERAQPSEHDVTFVHERDDAFDAMVSAFVDDDAETVHLVGMWVAPDLRGSGVARELVGRILEWVAQPRARAYCPLRRGRKCTRRTPIREMRLRRT